jgi:tetraprenyl-beta-curcumene synthase
VALTSAFLGAAARYWLGVFPLVGRELRHWRERAAQIPDPGLRRLALITQRGERGNLEGAAAFAVLAPRSQRVRVIRALVAYQVVYDYIDTLAEQPCGNPAANGYQLHLALLRALEPGVGHADYYEHCSDGADNGYIRNLIDTCRVAIASLPSYASVLVPSLRSARRIVAYQSLAHGCHPSVPAALASWAAAITPPGTGLHWWETAAGAASSMTVFALIAAAAHPALSTTEALATERAYFPWIGSLNVLLDSLVDRCDDLDAGTYSLIGHYRSAEEAAARLADIAARALGATELLPRALQHETILAAMASYYLSMPEDSESMRALATQSVMESMGTLARPSMAVLRVRRLAGNRARARM